MSFKQKRSTKPLRLHFGDAYNLGRQIAGERTSSDQDETPGFWIPPARSTTRLHGGRSPSGQAEDRLPAAFSPGPLNARPGSPGLATAAPALTAALRAGAGGGAGGARWGRGRWAEGPRRAERG